jgi:hypothetical protein
MRTIRESDMKIAQDVIRMDSSRAYLEKDEVKESLRVWVDQTQAAASSGNDRITISPEASRLLSENDAQIDEAEISQNMDHEISLKKLIAELLSGKRIDLLHIDKVNRQDQAIQEQTAADGASDNARQGWGVQYDHETTHTEKEDVSFTAQGFIKTSDNKRVAFTLKLDMSREYLEQNSISVRAGDAAIDPLILNFDGKAAELTDLKFAFDLDADGEQERISMPTAGRGFLAIDLNLDGGVSDGSELFGPSTGNGFSELRKYDLDGNGWIDENDEIFDELRVMTVDSEGTSSLQTLHDANVGAIYLGNESTRFDVRADGDNSLQGQVRTTGIYLKEDGTPDTIQQLDLMA